MISNRIINSTLIFLFIVLIGYSIAGSIAAGSWLGIVLAAISLAATVMFVYYLGKRQREMEQTERETGPWSMDQ